MSASVWDSQAAFLHGRRLDVLQQTHMSGQCSTACLTPGPYVACKYTVVCACMASDSSVAHLAIGSPGLVAATALQVIELDGAELVRRAADVDYA